MEGFLLVDQVSMIWKQLVSELKQWASFGKDIQAAAIPGVI